MRFVFRMASIVALTVIGYAVAQADLYSATEAYKAKDYQKAFNEFRELAELGNPQSQAAFGLLYFNGQGTGDFDKAVTAEQAAIKSAKKKGWSTKDLDERLATYNQKQTWQGELLTF